MNQEQLAEAFEKISKNLRPKSKADISLKQLANNQQPIMWAKAYQGTGKGYDPSLAKRDIPSSERRGHFYRLASVLPNVDSYFLAFFSELSEVAADAGRFFAEGKLIKGLRDYRVFLETLAVFNQSLKTLEKSAESPFISLLGELSTILTPLSIDPNAVSSDYVPSQFSERNLDLNASNLKNYKAKNINGQIRELSKSGCPSSTAAYAAVSQFCHPNYGVVWSRRDIGKGKVDPWDLVLIPITTSANEVDSQKRKIVEETKPLGFFTTESAQFTAELPARTISIRKKISSNIRRDARKQLPNLIDVLQKKDKCVCGSNKSILTCCASKRFRS